LLLRRPPSRYQPHHHPHLLLHSIFSIFIIFISIFIFYSASRRSRRPTFHKYRREQPAAWAGLRVGPPDGGGGAQPRLPIPAALGRGGRRVAREPRGRHRHARPSASARPRGPLPAQDDVLLA